MDSISEFQLVSAVDALARGGVIIIPTETVYGLACRWDCQDAREQIYKLKHRPASKRLQMLAADLETARTSGVSLTPELRKLAEAFWPGAMTVVVPDTINAGDSIGLRIPDHPVALEIIRRLGAPLACTSANLSGHPAALTPQEALQELDGMPDAVIDAGTVTVTSGLASTVVSLLAPTPEILREGPISLEQILKVVK